MSWSSGLWLISIQIEIILRVSHEAACVLAGSECQSGTATQNKIDTIGRSEREALSNNKECGLFIVSLLLYFWSKFSECVLLVFSLTASEKMQSNKI